MRPVWLFLALLVVAVPALVYGTFEWLLMPAGHGTKREIVTIKPGSGVATIAHDLHEQHLIRNELAFKAWLRFAGQDKSIKAGVYAVSPDQDARAIAGILAEGKGLSEHVTIPEGWSLKQIAAGLDKNTKGSGTRFSLLARHAAYFRPEFPWLGELPGTASLEGYLFPDTYVVAPGVDAERDLIRMMLGRFQQVALPAYERRKRDAGLSLNQAMTMASIVEKEARIAAERPLIAGVFYNRLAAHIPFGSDPTVEYALNRHQDARGLTFKDIRVDSPYNTYIHPGLPPGPIANPGLASLVAALQPANTRFVYFVAKGDGTHAFTETYAQHLAAQRQILSHR
ncbi:MAG: hypothetical protein JWM80_5143 [Cyanobacteria bacterium RYN_339]|nr:hypothetical protein [Cyanobacteria bacterium RYN_339]